MIVVVGYGGSLQRWSSSKLDIKDGFHLHGLGHHRSTNTNFELKLTLNIVGLHWSILVNNEDIGNIDDTDGLVLTFMCKNHNNFQNDVVNNIKYLSS